MIIYINKNEVINMKRFLSAFFAGILMFPISSLAEHHGNHFEFSILNSSWDTGISNVSGATLDEDDTGFAIVWGGPFTDNIDLEIGYADFGETSLSGSSGNTFDYKGTSYVFTATGTIAVEGDSFFVGIKPKMSLTDSLDAYARFGLTSWDTILTASSASGSADTSDDGVDLYYGFGVSGNISGFTLSLSHSIYEFDADDVDSTALSISVKF